MGKADKLIADMLIEHSINLLRFGAGERARVLAILQRMERELTTALVQEELSDTVRDRKAALLKQTSTIIGNYYDEINGSTQGKLSGLAKAAARAASEAMSAAVRVSLGVTLPTPGTLSAMASDALVHGAPTSAWWARQSDDTQFRFANEVRQGVAQGETSAQIVSRISGTRAKPGVMDITRQSASRLVQASVATVANTARRQTFEANSDVVDGIMQLSTLDGHTSDICLAYSGATWTMEYNDGFGGMQYTPSGDNELPYLTGTPRHWGCRSVEVPTLKTFASLGIDLPELPMSTRASRDGQVSANMTMKEWMDGRTDAQLDEQLGKGRAQLYRDGTITLQQLLDQSGNPLSLSQLLAKYGQP
jgi:hypothetical protein